MNWISFVLLFLSFSASAALTPDELRAYDELEGTAYVRRLVTDKKFAEAVTAYKDLSQAEQASASAKLQLAEAYIGLGDWKKALATSTQALEKSSKYKTALLSAKALSAWKLKDAQTCTNTFSGADRKELKTRDWLTWIECSQSEAQAQVALWAQVSQDDSVFLSRWSALRSNGLYQAADADMKNKLRICQSVSFYGRLAEVMEAKKASQDEMIEVALACYPKDHDIIMLGIQSHFKANRVRTATALFEKLAHDDPAYHHHVAEFMGSVGAQASATYWRVTTQDQLVSLKARSAQWVNDGNLAQVIALSTHAPQAMYDDPLRYATAYAFLKFAQMSQASHWVTPIKAKSLQTQVEQLSGMVKTCGELGWLCRP